MPWSVVLTLGWPQLLVLVVGLQRLFELWYSRRNARRLVAEGAVELGREHYPLIVGLQVAWLLALAFGVGTGQPLLWPWLLVYLVLQFLRVWIIASLGRYWTTRVYHLPDRPLVHRGPYRWLKHPNYLVVVAEVVVLPLSLGAWWAAAIFGPLQSLLLLWRLRAEEPALASRRRPF